MTEREQMIKFLGGDSEAVKITHALMREGIRTIEELRTERAKTCTYPRYNQETGLPEPYTTTYVLEDIRLMGPLRLARVDAALAGEL